MARLAKKLFFYRKQNPQLTLEDIKFPTPGEYSGKIKASLFGKLDLTGTKFVFLSSCSTARVSDFDEIQGFAQAVFEAGSPNLVAPLWDVDVRAALLFVKEFYKEYQNLSELGVYTNGRIGKCVKLAKNKLLRTGMHKRHIEAWTVFGIG